MDAVSSSSATASPNGISPDPATSTISRDGIRTAAACLPLAVVPTSALAAAVPSAPVTCTSVVSWRAGGAATGSVPSPLPRSTSQPPTTISTHPEDCRCHQQHPLAHGPPSGRPLGGPAAAGHHGLARHRGRRDRPGCGGAGVTGVVAVGAAVGVGVVATGAVTLSAVASRLARSTSGSASGSGRRCFPLLMAAPRSPGRPPAAAGRGGA